MKNVVKVKNVVKAKPGKPVKAKFTKPKAVKAKAIATKEKLTTKALATEAFLIGNGVSRTGFDLETLRGRGPIWGCNGLYRDFEPDVLCALDHGVLLELSNAGYGGVVGKLNKAHAAAVLGDALLPVKVPRGNGVAWYTGIFAAWLLCATQPELKRVFMLGYDLYDAKRNNVYAGTLNYEKMGINEKIQFENFKNLVFDKFKEVTFLRVGGNQNHSPLPDEWIFLDNVRDISYLDFMGYL